MKSPKHSLPECIPSNRVGARGYFVPVFGGLRSTMLVGGLYPSVRGQTGSFVAVAL